MSVVWKRPGLTGLETAWRWVVCVPLLLLACRRGGIALGSHGIDIGVHWEALGSLTVFKPVEALNGFGDFFSLLWGPLAPILKWLIPLFLVVWSIGAGIGRTFWLRRVEPELSSRPVTMALLTLLKLVTLLAVLAVWIAGWIFALRTTVIAPVARQQEANLVLLAAMVIGETLLLFMAWSVTSWILQLAPLIAMARRLGVFPSIVEAIRTPRETRSRLMETNLVMGIVKVGLLVLAMVFSACPLPFVTQETQGFLEVWCTGVAILWLVMSDYFHVVRTVAYLRFLEVGSRK